MREHATEEGPRWRSSRRRRRRRRRTRRRRGTWSGTFIPCQPQQPPAPQTERTRSTHKGRGHPGHTPQRRRRRRKRLVKEQGHTEEEEEGEDTGPTEEDDAGHRSPLDDGLDGGRGVRGIVERGVSERRQERLEAVPAGAAFPEGRGDLSCRDARARAEGASGRPRGAVVQHEGRGHDAQTRVDRVVRPPGAVGEPFRRVIRGGRRAERRDRPEHSAARVSVDRQREAREHGRGLRDEQRHRRRLGGVDDLGGGARRFGGGALDERKVVLDARRGDLGRVEGDDEGEDARKSARRGGEPLFGELGLEGDEEPRQQRGELLG
mmetsp:Transcript_3474/g.13440  ORF Transcript_3474/g.13440 Transcript_3474/m.13440 type:complete len:321 (-) Transcript_3474:347-1309(-)